MHQEGCRALILSIFAFPSPIYSPARNRNMPASEGGNTTPDPAPAPECTFIQA